MKRGDPEWFRGIALGWVIVGLIASSVLLSLGEWEIVAIFMPLAFLGLFIAHLHTRK
jgi:hypothetical protein